MLKLARHANGSHAGGCFQHVCKCFNWKEENSNVVKSLMAATNPKPLLLSFKLLVNTVNLVESVGGAGHRVVRPWACASKGEWPAGRDEVVDYIWPLCVTLETTSHHCHLLVSLKDQQQKYDPSCQDMELKFTPRERKAVQKLQDSTEKVWASITTITRCDRVKRSMTYMTGNLERVPHIIQQVQLPCHPHPRFSASLTPHMLYILCLNTS